MKRCPMCGSNAPDGATICYECLYSFQDMSCVAIPPKLDVPDEVDVAPSHSGGESEPVSTRHPSEYELVVTDDEFGRRAFSLESGTVHIGRLPTNDVVLNDRYVSRRHLHVFFEANEMWAEDFGSSNPARLNGLPLTGKVAFRPGDLIEIRGVKVELIDLSFEG